MPAATSGSTLRVLWPWIRPHARVLVVAQVIALLGAAAGLASPLATKSVVDGWSGRPSLNGPVGVLLALLTASLVLSIVQQVVLAWAGTKAVERARIALADSLLRVQLGQLAGRHRGELVPPVSELGWPATPSVCRPVRQRRDGSPRRWRWSRSAAPVDRPRHTAASGSTT